MKRSGKVRAQKDEAEREKMSLSEIFKLPQDAVKGESLLTFIGTTTVRIENYRSILIYSDTLIKIQAKKYKVLVAGKRLKIRYYDKDEMEITGRIASVSFE